MNALELSGDQWNLILLALREKASSDAKIARHLPEPRLARQFDQQASDSAALANHIEQRV